MSCRIYIEGNEIDQFKEETIDYNRSLVDLQDLEKIKTDFSRAFTIPASPRNNRYFKHYYNANINNSFDARKSVSGNIELNGFPFSYGKWKLNKVTVRNGKAFSYTINYVGNLINLVEKCGEKTLQDLDFSSYDFNMDLATSKLESYNRENISFPLMYNKQLYYNSHNSDNTNTETLQNLDYEPIEASKLRPSIRNRAIFDVINTDLGVKIYGDFLDSTRFADLYLRCAFNEVEEYQFKTPVFFDDVNSYTISLTENHGISSLRIDTETSNDSVWGIVVEYGDKTYTRYDKKGDNNDIISINVFDAIDIKVYILNSTQNTFNIEVFGLVFLEAPLLLAESLNTNIDYNFIISENIPDIKIIDYISGLFKAFKLIALPDENGDILVLPLEDYLNQGKIVNLDKYVSVDTYDVEPVELYSEIDFSFEDSETILNDQFESLTGSFYGNESLTLYEDDGETPLDGDSYEINVPFEQVLYERLNDENTGEQTNICYGGLFDSDIGSKEPSVLLHYINNISIIETPFNVLSVNDTETQITSLNVPSNSVSLGVVDSDDVPFSFLFSNEFNFFDGYELTNNLYSNYHKGFINRVFDFKRRDLTLPAVIPSHIISGINLNDVLEINSNYYRINSIDGDITTNNYNLNLYTVNDVNELGKPIESYYVTKTEVIYYPFEFTSVKTSEEDGTDWFNILKDGENIVITIDNNDTTNKRSGIITLTTENNYTTIIYIYNNFQ